MKPAAGKSASLKRANTIRKVRLCGASNVSSFPLCVLSALSFAWNVQDEVASWMKEGMKLKETRLEEASANLLDMSLEDLFHVEPSRRGQRRANLFKQRMAEAAAEDAVRKGKGEPNLKLGPAYAELLPA